jgi:LysM repeat protein
MRIIALLGWLLLVSTLTGYSQVASKPQSLLTSPQKNMVRMLTKKDTLEVFVNELGQKFIVHKLKKGQTLYSLAKFYDLTLDELYAINPSAKTNLQPGMELMFPIQARDLLRKKDERYIDSLYIPVRYEVKKGEYIYGISRRFFNMEDALLRQLNNMSPNAGVHPGDKLLVGWFHLYGLQIHSNRDSVAAVLPPSPLVKLNVHNKKLFDAQAQNKKLITTGGMAFWDKTQSPSKTPKLYALHRYATGFVQVTNPMNKRTLYVQVVGKIPEANYEDRIEIILDPSVAKALGALDPQFNVKVSYCQ